MSFLKCCIGADQRPDPESIRPVAATHRRTASNSNRHYADASTNKKKVKLPTEVFFDPSKPDGQLSSVTDPPHSTREYADAKKRKDAKDARLSHQRERKPTTDGRPSNLETPDNNGLTRGQNFMKVEKWLRQASMYQQIDITPHNISNIEDTPTTLSENAADPPSEKDRLPPALISQLATATRSSARS